MYHVRHQEPQEFIGFLEVKAGRGRPMRKCRLPVNTSPSPRRKISCKYRTCTGACPGSPKLGSPRCLFTGTGVTGSKTLTKTPGGAGTRTVGHTDTPVHNQRKPGP